VPISERRILLGWLAHLYVCYKGGDFRESITPIAAPRLRLQFLRQPSRCRFAGLTVPTFTEDVKVGQPPVSASRSCPPVRGVVNGGKPLEKMRGDLYRCSARKAARNAAFEGRIQMQARLSAKQQGLGNVLTFNSRD
jgi:hypothetical protein